MATITRPAIEIQQGHLTLYLTYVTPADLFIPEFYAVEQLEPLEPEVKGFQRILDPSRANRLSRHLIKGFDSGYSNLPTTIFLATDKPISFDPATNEMSLETDEVCPFSVVDGQHRIEGLLSAAKTQPNLRDFKLPATIATSLDRTHQMYHFYIVNTTQRPVEKELEQQITTRFTDMKGIEDLPYLPFWFAEQVSRGTVAQSLKLAQFLNETPDSPLYGRIQMANDPRGGRGRIKQAGLVNMFKTHVFAGTNPIAIREIDADKRNHIMLNYFRAIDSIFVETEHRESSNVYKNNGLFFFLVISKWVFTEMYAGGLNFTEDSIAQMIRSAIDEMDFPYSEIADPGWWLPGQGASSLNRASAQIYAGEFLHALSRLHA